MRTRNVLLAALLIGLISSPVWAAPTEIVSFGDSLTDMGNLYVDSGRTFPPSPRYFDGRFSNGPVWVERLAGELKLPAPAPNLTGGANYAWGGAATGGGFSFFDTPNVGMQIDLYLEPHTPTNTTLFTLWAGANDVFEDQSDPAPVVANLSGHIRTLAAAGGQHFLVGNLPPLGKFPSVLGTPASPLLDALTVQFNGLLSSELDNLQSLLGVTIYRLDAYNIYQSILANPGAYGLTNVTGRAFNDTTVVPNPDQYLFWDGDHPTRVVSQLLGDAAAATLTPLVTADFDEDGDVDAADLTNWKSGFGISGSATRLQGDADGDDDVDGADFLAWQRDLGSGAAHVNELDSGARVGGTWTRGTVIGRVRLSATPSRKAKSKNVSLQVSVPDAQTVYRGCACCSALRLEWPFGVSRANRQARRLGRQFIRPNECGGRQ